MPFSLSANKYLTSQIVLTGLHSAHADALISDYLLLLCSLQFKALHQTMSTPFNHRQRLFDSKELSACQTPTLIDQ